MDFALSDPIDGLISITVLEIAAFVSAISSVGLVVSGLLTGLLWHLESLHLFEFNIVQVASLIDLENDTVRGIVIVKPGYSFHVFTPDLHASFHFCC